MANPWTRRATVLLALLVLGAVAGLPWTAHDLFVQDIDAALYLRTSLSILRGNGYTYLGVPFELRPPGFPVLLAPVLGAFGVDFRAITVYVSLWGAFAAALLFVWLRGRLGDFPAFALAASLWINPEFQNACNMAMSDVPGVTFLLAALLAESWARRGTGLKREIAAGAMIAAATYVRSLSVLLLPAIVLSRWAERPGRFGFLRMAALCGTCAALMAPWSLRNHRYEQEAPADQTWLYSQSVAMWHTDRGNPTSPVISREEVQTRVGEQFRWMTSELGNRLRATRPTSRHFVFGLVGATCLLVVAGRRRRTGDIYALGCSAVLLLWHASPDRLLLPLLLFVPPAVVEVLLPRATRWMGGRAAGAAIAAAVIVLGVLDARDGTDWTALEVRNREQRDAAVVLGEWLEDDDILATTVFAWRDSVYLDRPVYNLRPALRRGGADDAAAVVEKYGVNVVVLRSGTEADFREYLERDFTCTVLEPGLSVCRRERRPGRDPASPVSDPR